MISNELRVQIFGAYLFNHFRYEGSINTIRVIGGISRGWSIIDDVDKEKYRVDKCKLILTPLNLLTHEHAIAIAKIAGYEDCEGTSLRVDLVGGIYLVGGMYRCRINLYKMAITDYSYSTDHVVDYPLANPQKIIDFLRNNGYDVGYGHIESLIQAGVAISISDTHLSTQSPENDNHIHPDIIGEAIIEPEEV